jgi:CheY-like chemotaxis protein
LLVEDNAADVRLLQEALKEADMEISMPVAGDGAAALAFLRREGKYAHAPRPDLVLLDLNLPKIDGREVLAEIKRDPGLRIIPVVVLTTSRSEEDVLKSYDLHANCYITKPVNLERFLDIVKSIKEFWLTVARLPTMGGRGPRPDFTARFL